MFSKLEFLLHLLMDCMIGYYLTYMKLVL